MLPAHRWTAQAVFSKCLKGPPLQDLPYKKFKYRRERETLRLVHGVRSGILQADAEVPFELRVLEALLSETVRQFERHLKRLLLLSESVEREVTHVLKSSTGDLTRLLPIQK